MGQISSICISLPDQNNKLDAALFRPPRDKANMSYKCIMNLTKTRLESLH